MFFFTICILSSNNTPFEDIYGCISEDNDSDYNENSNFITSTRHEIRKRTKKRLRHFLDSQIPLEERIEKYKKRLERKMREQNLKDIKEKERLKNRRIYDVMFDCIRHLISNYFNMGLSSGLIECTVDFLFSIMNRDPVEIARSITKILLSVPLIVMGAIFGTFNPAFGLSNGAEYGYEAANGIVDAIYGRRIYTN